MRWPTHDYLHREWRNWFAWYPVSVRGRAGMEMVWLEWLSCRYVGGFAPWEYVRITR